MFLIDCLIFLLFLSSSFGANILSLPILGVQLTLFRILLCFLFIVLLYRKEKLTVYLPRRIIYNLNLIMLLYSLITILWADDIYSWIKAEFFVMEGVIAVILLKKVINSRRRVKIAFFALECSALIQAVIGLIEMVTGVYHFAPEKQLYYITRFGISSPVAMQYNVNNFGALMLLGGCFAYSLFSDSKNVYTKLFHALCGLIFSALVYFSTSRACLLGLIAIVIFNFLFLKKNSMRKFFAGILILSMIIVFRGNLLSYLTIDRRFDGIRINLIKNGLEFLISTFFFGIGIGQESIWLKNNSVYPTGGVLVFHNWWIELLCGFGLIIALYFLLSYVILFIYNFKKSRDQQNQWSNLSKGFVLFLVAFVFSSCCISSTINQEWFWIIWGLLVAFYENNCHYQE